MSNQGFTLLELLIVLTIAAILLGIAVPAFDGYVKRNAVEALENELNTSITLARGEALTRQRPISIACIRTVDKAGEVVECSGDWSNGWEVFVDDGEDDDFADGKLDTGEEVLFTKRYNGRAHVKVTDPDESDANESQLQAITLNFRGSLRDDSRAFALFCAPSNESNYARGLMLERSGRLMRSRDHDSDGVHDKVFEAADGTTTSSNLVCST